MAAVALALAALVGLAAGWLLHRHHVRGLVARLLAADTATTGTHRIAVLTDHAARLGAHPRRLT